ncbi:Gfo/Idh/MocA family protein [Lachnoclostridium sp. An169]|uniref:Gfo/Idh/MocA family protein n=1 Tax=Lachnoclostridium sp. An169 TaxID=1965569 RepID=UPI0019513280|nr:Gfo/Idh/MocA family oxidoreductase [Lachnoclostridium sp. An169]
MKKICIGVIGYGVRIDMLMDQMRALPVDVEVTAVADKNPARVRELMLKNGTAEEMHRFEIDKIDGLLRKCPMNPDQIHFYETAEEMLEKEELDGVMVGTNCNTHAHFAKMVMEKNLPLFLEKPVGICHEDLELLKECDSKPHAPVVVSFPLRTTKMIQTAKKIVEAGTIGKVDHVQAFNDVGYGFVYFHDWYRDESVAHGLFLQKATHDIDVINYLCGEDPEMVCAMKSKQIFKGDMPAGLRCSECDRTETCMESTYNIEKVRSDTPRSDYCCFAVDTGNEDSGSMIVRYESGMHAIYSQNFFARKKAARRGGRIYGYKGTLEYDFIKDEIHVYDHMSDAVTTMEFHTPANGHGGGDQVLMQNFVDLIRGKVSESIAPLRAGIISAQTCLAAKEASEQMEYRKVKGGADRE